MTDRTPVTGTRTDRRSVSAHADAATTGAGRPGRYVAAAIYWAVARQLPWSSRPGGRAARALRALLDRHMLDACGRAVNVEHGAWFGSGRGVRLGDRSSIGMDALVMGPIDIGKDVMMGPRCMLVSNRHNIGRDDVPMNAQGFADALPIVVEDDVFLGAGSIVLAGVRIGTGSVVGAGAVVSKDVPSGCVVAGNPAKVVRRR